MAAPKIDPETRKPLPRGIWYRGPAQYQARMQVDGRRIRRTFETAALAQAWLEQAGAKTKLGQPLDSPELEKITIGRLVENYRDQVMKDGREQDRVGHIPALLADAQLSMCRLSAFKAPVVRAWRDRMIADGYSPATVVKRLNLLASIVNYANSEWLMQIANPASGSVIRRPPGADKKRNRRLVEEESEAERLFAAISLSSCPDDLWLVKFSIEQGTRRSEAASLRWRDVNFNRRELKLHHTKTHKHQKEKGPEIRPLTPGAIRVLRDKLASQEQTPASSEMIFAIGTMTAFSMRYRRLVARAGLEDLTFHDLRHEATSRLARILKSPLDLKRVTGHRDLRSLDRYYQPIPADISKLIEDSEDSEDA